MTQLPWVHGKDRLEAYPPFLNPAVQQVSPRFRDLRGVNGVSSDSSSAGIASPQNFSGLDAVFGAEAFDFFGKRAPAGVANF